MTVHKTGARGAFVKCNRWLECAVCEQRVVGHANLVFILKCSGAEKCFRPGFKITEKCLGTLTAEKTLQKHHSCLFSFLCCLTFMCCSFRDSVCDQYYMRLKHLSSDIIFVACFFSCVVFKELNSFLCCGSLLVGFL